MVDFYIFRHVNLMRYGELIPDQFCVNMSFLIVYSNSFCGETDLNLPDVPQQLTFGTEPTAQSFWKSDFDQHRSVYKWLTMLASISPAIGAID